MDTSQQELTKHEQAVANAGDLLEALLKFKPRTLAEAIHGLRLDYSIKGIADALGGDNDKWNKSILLSAFELLVDRWIAQMTKRE